MARRSRDLATIIKIAQLRYERGMSQADIAEALGMSPATISRHLAEATELHLIEIRVVESVYRNRELERRLTARLGLEDAVVVFDQDSGGATHRILGSAAARSLAARLSEHSVIGVSNGETTAQIAAEMPRGSAPEVEIVTMIGGVGKAERPTHTANICRTIAQATGGRARSLPIPALLETEEMARLMRGTEAYGMIADLYERMDIALFGIGTLLPDSSTVRDGLFTQRQLESAVAEGAVGTICARFFDLDGHPVSADYEARTVSVTFEELRKVPVRFGVARGLEKLDAILASTRGGLVNVLATDTTTAEAVLARGN